MRRARSKIDFDRALSDLPAPLRWREYMMRVEAVIFAASRPVSRETLSALIGSDCNLDLLIADIRDELKSTSSRRCCRYRGRPMMMNKTNPGES
jgi:segregation and condensation protein B